MKVVVPLRGITAERMPAPVQPARIVVFVLEQEVNRTLKRARTRSANSSSKSGLLSSLIACTASRRSPSSRNSSIQYSAFE